MPRRLARILGILCGPPLIPIALLSLTIAYGAEPLRTRDVIAFALCLAVLPAFIVYGAYRVGYVTNLGMPDRRPRVLIATISLACALLSVVALSALGAASILIALAAGISLQMFVLDLLTMRTKVSYHSAGTGLLTVAGLYLGGPSLAVPLGAVALATGWSRWYLGKHTVRQIALGFGSSLALAAWLYDLAGRTGFLR